MTPTQVSLIFQLIRTPDFVEAIKAISATRVEKAFGTMAIFVDKGDLNGAALARGEARAWSEVLQVLEREAAKAKPDNS